MTTYVAVPQGYGTLGNPQAPTVADKISGGDVYKGAILEVHAGATPATVTFVDGGRTPGGNTGTQAGQVVAANTTRRFKTDPKLLNSAGELDVTYSQISTITYELYY